MKKILCVIIITLVLVALSSCTQPLPADTLVPTVTPAPVVETMPAYTWEFDPTPRPTYESVLVVTPTPNPWSGRSWELRPSTIPTPISIIIAQPEDQIVAENDLCYFYAEHFDGSVGTWHIVSPDDRIDIHAEWIGSVMPPAVFVECDDYNGLTIHNTLARLDGWKVYCQFNDGTKTDNAYIIIDKTQPRVGIEMPPM